MKDSKHMYRSVLCRYCKKDLRNKQQYKYECQYFCSYDHLTKWRNETNAVEQ